MMAYLMPVSQMLNRSRGTVKIGDTLFVDGSPHVECGFCGVAIKLHDSRKITIGYWPPKEEILTINPVTNVATIEAVKKPPVLKKAHGCADCFNRQDTEQRIENLRKLQPTKDGKEDRHKTIFYMKGEAIGGPSGLTPGELPAVRKKEWKEGLPSQKGFNTTVTR
jgi:hypothetical protein